MIYNQNFTETFEQIGPNSLRIGNNENSLNTGKRLANISIYPNPNTGECTITHDLELTSGSVTLTIYDLVGKANNSTVLGQNSTQLNLNLPPGVYFYSISQNGEVVRTDKLIIQ